MSRQYMTGNPFWLKRSEKSEKKVKESDNCDCDNIKVIQAQYRGQNSSEKCFIHCKTALDCPTRQNSCVKPAILAPPYKIHV